MGCHFEGCERLIFKRTGMREVILGTASNEQLVEFQGRYVKVLHNDAVPLLRESD
jgi:hypothetical protein